MVYAVIILLSAATIVLLFMKALTDGRALEAKAAKLDDVCEDVRESLCNTRKGLDHRPGFEGSQPPRSGLIDVCASGVWNEWKLAQAVKSGDYEKELRSQVDQAIHAIPELYPNVHECRP